MKHMDTAALKDLVKPDRVHLSVYSDPAVFDLEMERIFERNWVYVAHESELPAPGDYTRAMIGRRDIIICRTDAGAVAAFHNRCSHRGSMVAVAPSGHVNSFMCPYHGWTFDREGHLAHVPLSNGYPEGFAEGPARRLEPVARVDSYRGFIFASLSADVPSLVEHLGAASETIDNLVDRAPAGRLTKPSPDLRQVYNGNWKLNLENTFDNIHTFFVHHSSWGAQKEWERETKPPVMTDQQILMMKANGLPLRDWEQSEIRALDRGHAINGAYFSGTRIAIDRPEPWFATYREALAARHGQTKAEEVLSMERFNTLIYPNLIINVRFQYIRVFQPLSVDRTMVRSFCFRLEGAPEEIFHVGVRFLTALSSPASMVAQDDHEVFNRIQRALSARVQGVSGGDADWIDLSRNYGLERVRSEGGIDGMSGVSELALRNQMTAWLGYMTAAGEEIPR